MTTNAAADKTAANIASDKGPDKTSEKLAEKRRALGRGLESLLPGPRVVAPHPSAPVSAQQAGANLGYQASHPAPAAVPADAASGQVEQLHAVAAADGETVVMMAIDQIDRNPYQTRTEFDERALEELAASIRVQGVLQPIVVRPGKDGVRFILILGERRLRASIRAEKTTIPAVVKRVSAQQAAEMTVVENLQRQDLSCVDQAQAFENLARDFRLTQEQIGARVGLSREQVSNYLRLLNLPEGVRLALQKGTLSYSHARTLMKLKDQEQQWRIAQKAMAQKMSVAKLEELLFGVTVPSGPGGTASVQGGGRWMDPNVKAAQRSLEEVLGMKVRIRDRNGRGKILIEYSTIDDFDRVVMMLKGK